jgi:hypothetical protein
MEFSTTNLPATSASSETLLLEAHRSSISVDPSRVSLVSTAASLTLGNRVSNVSSSSDILQPSEPLPVTAIGPCSEGYGAECDGNPEPGGVAATDAMEIKASTVDANAGISFASSASKQAPQPATVSTESEKTSTLRSRGWCHRASYMNVFGRPWAEKTVKPPTGLYMEDYSDEVCFHP